VTRVCLCVCCNREKGRPDKLSRAKYRPRVPTGLEQYRTGPARLGSAVSHFGSKSPPAGRSGATGWLLMSAAPAYRVSARVRDRLSD